MPVLEVGDCRTRMSSNTDQFSQVEEHPVDGWCIGNMRLYVNTECISDSSHIIASQYCSVSHYLLTRARIHKIHACHSNQFLFLIIAITLLMNLQFEYQLKVCVSYLRCDVQHVRVTSLRITNGPLSGPSVHCSVK